MAVEEKGAKDGKGEEMEGLVNKDRFRRPNFVRGPAAGVGEPMGDKDKGGEKGGALEGGGVRDSEGDKGNGIDEDVHRAGPSGFELVGGHPVGLEEVVAEHVEGDEPEAEQRVVLESVRGGCMLPRGAAGGQC